MKRTRPIVDLNDGTRKGAFFVKCRPQDADIIDLVKDVRRVFIGYPPWRKGVTFSREHISRCIIDLRGASEDWKAEVRSGCYRPSMAANHKLANSVSTGWIVVVPRPSLGFCWLGEIAGPFELVENPEWSGRYLQFRHDEMLDCDDEESHIGDIVQSWPVKEFKEVPFGLVPRWISYRFFHRASAGLIEGFPEFKLDSHATLSLLLQGQRPVDLTEPASELEEIERRLLTFIGPSAFEHLCVSLLQLEEVGGTWWHTGGAGDGGADGLYYDSKWQTSAVLQCKWYLHAASLSEIWLDQRVSRSSKFYLAALVHGDVRQDVDGIEFWTRRRIAELVWKHRNRLPIASALNIE